MKRMKSSVIVLAILAMIVTLIPNGFLTTVRAEERATGDTRVADDTTLDGWKQYFGGSDSDFNTQYSGHVWTDKSVTTDASKFKYAAELADGSSKIALNNGQNNFLVSLSAMASSKSVTGQDNKPTDTMIVLDMSSSMYKNSTDRDPGPVTAMIEAVNELISQLQELNVNNRVGVTIYYGGPDLNQAPKNSYQVWLPLGRYKHSTNKFLVAKTSGGKLASAGVNSNVTTEAGQAVTQRTRATTDTAGTYMQQGILSALDEFMDADPKVPDNAAVNAGETRTPVMVLMSDGKPTAATNLYTQLDKVAIMGSNREDIRSANETDFLTQLTAAYAKEMMDAHYKETSLFYTLSYGNGFSYTVMDPSGTLEKKDTEHESKPATVSGYWSRLLASNSITLNYIVSKGQWDKNTTNKNCTVSKTTVNGKTFPSSASQQYYVDKAFEAATATDLAEAFANIFTDISLQTHTYPTLVDGDENLDGYISFVDKIGEYMNVTDVKGILLGDHWYSGKELSKNFVTGGGALGTISDPTALGDELVWSIQQRLGLPNSNTVRTLLALAYQYGQLSYNDDGSYSNYVGWYSDAQGNYLGFWAEGVSKAPANATHVNKSYIYLGETDASHGVKNSDMMYTTVRVRHEIATGVESVNFAIPAALIPVVEYDVEYDENDKLTEVKRGGADHPIRLVYEVALDDSINEYTIHDVVDSDYISQNTDDEGYVNFYTNQYEVDGKVGYGKVNTYSYFRPSHQNENYYYQENEPVYVDQNGTVYNNSSAPDPNGTFYREITVYSKTGSTIKEENIYRQLSSAALETAVAKGDGTWYIPKGNVHVNLNGYTIAKTLDGHKTDTLPNANLPYVDVNGHHVNDTDHKFVIGDTLGNNGKVRIKPETGIKIVKKVDETLVADDTLYEFTLTTDASVNGEFVLLKEAAGSQTKETVVFTNGTATVSLKANESVTIFGNSEISFAGKKFIVSETEEDNYEVLTIDGVSSGNAKEITAVENKIIETVFVNTEVVTGDVTVHKTVISEHSEHKTDSLFQIGIKLTAPEGKELKNSYPAQLFVTDVNGVDTVDGVVLVEEGKAYFKPESGTKDTVGVSLHHNDYLHISGLRAGTKVTVTEQDPAYFEVAYQNNDTVVEAGQVKDIHVTNTYKITTDASAEFTLKGTKIIDGENFNFNGKEFKFRLEKQVGSSFVPIKEYTVAEGSLTFGDSNITYSFAAPGTFSYRIIEVIPEEKDKIPGIIYDPVECFFTIIVEDQKDGTLAVTDVQKGNDTEVKVEYHDDKETVKSAVIEVEFTNVFEVEGAAEAVFNLKKMIESTDGEATISPAGFKFDVYATDDKYQVAEDAILIKEVVSDVFGNAVVNFIYGQKELTGNYYYVIRESLPKGANAENNYTVNGITYAVNEYRAKVSVSIDSDAKPKISVQVMDEKGNQVYPVTSSVSEGNSVVKEIVTGLNFVNKYKPESTSLVIPITGTKTLTNWPSDMNKPDFVFNLYEADANGVKKDADTSDIDIDPIQTAVVKGSGAFVFETLSFTKSGDYYYVVNEALPSGANGYTANGMSYDSREYLVHVKVTGNSTGKLSATIVDTLLQGNSAVIEFANSYKPDDVSLTLKGSKKLISEFRVLSLGEFSFELYETDSKYDITGLTPIQTVSNNEDGSFRFALSYDEKSLEGVSSKSFYYVIKEELPLGANSENNYTVNGIQYDTDIHKVKVTVTDSGKGTLATVVEVDQVKVDSNQTEPIVVFKNEYKVEPAYVDIPGKKTLEGALLKAYANQFKFDLYRATVNSDQEWSATELLKTADLQEDGTFEFKDLEFTVPGTYYYMVKERVTNTDERFEFDYSVYYVTVHVNDPYNGQLMAVRRINRIGETVNLPFVSFNNVIYPIEETVQLEGEKVLNNWPSSMNSGLPEFVFNLYESNKDGEKLDANLYDDDIDPLLSTSVKGSGTFVFKDFEDDASTSGIDESTNYFEYTSPGTHYFVIEEQVPADVDAELKSKGITYDAAVYLAKVEVSLTKANDTLDRDDLTSHVTYYKKTASGFEELTQKETVKFTNSYEPFEEVEKDVFQKGFTYSIDGRIVSFGDVLTYTVTYTNSSYGENLEKVTITDEIPSGVEYVENSASHDGRYSDGVLLWELSGVEPGQSVTVSFDVKVTAEPGTDIENDAVVEIDGNKYYTNETYNTVVTEKDVVKDDGSGVLVSIDGQAVQPNDILTYQILYVNSSDTEVAKTVTIEDMIPKGTEYVRSSASHQGVYSNGTLTWTLNNVQPNESVTVSFQVKVVEHNAAVIKNQGIVVVGGNKYCTNEVFNYIVVKEVDQHYVNLGDPITYTISYINYEKTPSTVTITDKLEEGLTFVSAENGGMYNAEKHEITWTINNVPSGESGTVRFKAAINEKAVTYVVNDATIQVGHNPSVVTNPVTVSLLEHVSFDAVKELVGRDLQAGEFKFELYETDESFVCSNRAIQTKSNDNNGAVKFDELEYEDLGTHYYVIKEVLGTLGGVTYDQSEYHITVTLTKNDADDVVVTKEITKAGKTVSDIIFTNEYGLVEDAETEVVIKGDKHLNGRPWGEQDVFEFELYETNSSYDMTAESKLIDSTSVSKSSQSFSFKAMKYTNPGTYYYVVKETTGSIPGVNYDDALIEVQVVVKDNGAGELTHDVLINGDIENTILFINDYETVPSEFDLKGSKAISGRDLNKDEFSFVLYETNSLFQNRTELAKTKNEADGSFKFKVANKVPGTYYFVIEEEKGSLGGVTYDTSHYHVTVVVSDNLQGGTRAESTYVKYTPGSGASTSAMAEFTNSYTVEDKVGLTLVGTKQMTGREAVNGEFSFELYEADSDFVIAQGAQPLKTAVNQNGTFTFDELKYQQTGEYYYVVKETNGGQSIDGVNYSAEELKVKVVVTDDLNGELVAKAVDGSGNEISNIGTFNNVYQPAPVDVQFEGTKVLHGRDWMASDVFTFDLYKADSSFNVVGDVIQTVSVNSPNETFKFDSIRYSGQSTNYYVIKEAAGSIPGVEYDKTVFGVEVNVKDNLNGTLSTNVKYYANGSDVNAVIFNNFYEINEGAEVSVVLHGTKLLEGRQQVDGEFSFALYKADSNFAIQSEEAVRTAVNQNGAFKFDALTYTASMFAEDKVLDDNGERASYYYVVKEVPGTSGGVTYDSKSYYYQVVITDNGHGGLHLEHTLMDENREEVTSLEFKNTYESSPEADIVIGGSKAMTGRNPKEGEFTFVLYEANSSFGSKNMLQETKNDASGNFSFDKIENKAAGMYYFVIEEKPDNLQGITYDKSHYHVIVEIIDTGKGYTELKSTEIKKIEHTAEGTVKPVDASNIVFNNIYEAVDTEGLVIAGTKNLTGREAVNGEFVFELYSVKSDFVVQEGASPVKTAVNKDGKFEFEELRYDTEGTYYYVVKEKNLASGGITYDESLFNLVVDVWDNYSGELQAEYRVENSTEISGMIFNNTYVITTPASTSVSGVKEINGRQWLDTDTFTFELYETDVDYVIVNGSKAVKSISVDKNNPEFEFSFSYDDLNDLGHHYYVIKEVEGTLGGMTYDNREYHVDINVIDNYDGTLSVTSEMKLDNQLTDLARFVNYYEATSTKEGNGLPLIAEKSMANRPLFNEEFSFELYKTDDTFAISGNPIQIVKNDASGYVQFEKLDFNVLGNHYFVMKESTGTLGGVTYDESIYQITIEVTDGLDGYYYSNLASITKVDLQGSSSVTEMEFKNTYTPSPTTDGIILEAIKVLNGKSLKADDFTFALFETDQDYVPKDVAEQIKKNDENGLVVFDELQFSKEGTYYYVIQEINENKIGITYDDSVYCIEIKVTDDYTGQLKSELISITKENQPADEIEFVNTYTEPPVPEEVIPETYDDSNIMTWAGSSIVSLLLAILLTLSKKRRHGIR